MTPTSHLCTVAAACCFACALAAIAPRSVAAETDLPRLADDYRAHVFPLIERYCADCHGADEPEAELNLLLFDSLAAVGQHPSTWQKIAEMLDQRDMPPRDSAQPSDAERKQLESWIDAYLDIEAARRAGDPGPVILRRLSNAEYDYTVRDLTGVAELEPTREFPVDGAAGEGFTNVGSGQAMSPSLVQKYLDAAKQVASHLVLLPDGIAFSPHTTRRDQTDELLTRIQDFYREFTVDGDGTAVIQQGIDLEVARGGQLPLERYLAATLAEREALHSGQRSIEQVSTDHQLNPRYLAALWQALTADREQPSLLLDALRSRWQHSAASDAATLAAEIAAAQRSLWKFNSIGHIGREGAPERWMEPASPLVTSQPLRVPLAPAANNPEVMLTLSAHDLDDGNTADYVIWQQPRLEFDAGDSGVAHPPILLRDVRTLASRLAATRASQTARTAEYLAAVRQLADGQQSLDELAARHDLNPRLLERWARITGLAPPDHRPITGHFRQKQAAAQGYDAINGWGENGLSILTNKSDQEIRFLTLAVPARGVVVHPSPTQAVQVAWRSPHSANVRVTGRVADSDDKCGNGACWRLELRTRSGATTVADGTLDNGQQQTFAPETPLAVGEGDVLALIVDPRDRDHTCDTTHVELQIRELDGAQHTWDLASDVVDAILTANPLPDAHGHADVWHFGAAEPPRVEYDIPADSALARWSAAAQTGSAPPELAAAVQQVLTSADPAALSAADAALRTALLDCRGPLNWLAASELSDAVPDSPLGLDPASFGQHPDGTPLPATDICLQAPAVVQIRLPAELAAGATFVAAATLAPGQTGSVQVRATAAAEAMAASPNSADGEHPLPMSPAHPILIHDDAATRERLEHSLDAYRQLFPAALCYARIVPVDEVVTLTLYYREDDHLRRLMLDDEQAVQLDRLWDELLFVSQEPLQMVVSFEQISEFATQDRPDLVEAFAPMRAKVLRQAEAFRQRQLATEPLHLEAIVALADRAWRRPLSHNERLGLRQLYRQLREQETPHDQAAQLTLARVLTAPGFLFKLEQPAAGAQAAPVDNWELAARLSYFLGSSLPDEPLRAAAAAGHLTDEAELLAQTRRMLRDPRARRLAIHFACQWLHVRDFDRNDDKNEALFPQFADLRADMYEETVLFFEDMIRRDGSILGVLEADHTFLNEALAAHYGIAGVGGDHWRRVDGVRAAQRGGVLAMATFLASQSGASRTSPILRGNWVYETLFGKRLPRPPANVPQLPEAPPEGLSERELIERHSSEAACAKCHAKIDPYGFALEQYDAIGALRPVAANTRTTLPDGTTIDGLDELRQYLRTARRDDYLRQFCRKLLGYALGREVQLSDRPLLDAMRRQLEADDYRFSAAVSVVVASPQFRQIRGQEFTAENE